MTNRTDAERLDFLERLATKVEVVEIVDNVRGREGFSLYGMGASEEPSEGLRLRDAIDAEMQAEDEGLAAYEQLRDSVAPNPPICRPPRGP